MRRRTKVITITAVAVIVLGGIVVIAGPLVYRDFIAAPAAEAPTLSAEKGGALDPAESDVTEGGILDPAALTGTWQLAEGSEAGYRVDEVLRGVDVPVTGRTSELTGSLTVDGLALTEASFEIDVASIATDQPPRDQYFRETALRVGEHPTASFELTEPVALDTAPASGEVLEHEFTGDLTIAGVTRSVTFTAQARTDGTTAEVAGQIPITFADFGVAAPDLSFVKVDPTGFIDFSLVFTKT